MFPPKIVESLEEAAAGLHASLQRAGDYWQDEYNINDFDASRTWIIYKLTHPVPINAKQSLKSYAMEYIKKCGWKVKKVDIHATYVGIVIENV
jgi:hypothetical protein